MVGLTGCPALLHSTTIGVVAPEILPPLGVGPATLAASASVMTDCARTVPPSAVTITGPATVALPSDDGVTVSLREHRSQPTPEAPSVTRTRGANRVAREDGRTFIGPSCSRTAPAS